MRTSMLMALACFSFLAHAQLQKLNPATYPYQTNSMHIFPDNTAYATSGGTFGGHYFIKLDDIQKPFTTRIKILEHPHFILRDLYCANKKKCWTKSSQNNIEVWRKTLDSGKTWQLVPTMNSRRPYFADSLLWLDLRGSRYVHLEVSKDQGLVWNKPFGSDTAYYLNAIDSSAIVYNTSNDSVYRIWPSGLEALFHTKTLFPNLCWPTAVFPTDTGYVVGTSSRFCVNGSGNNYIYSVSRDFSSATIIDTLNGRMNFARNSKSNIIVFGNSEKYLWTSNLGTTWQTDTSDEFPYNVNINDIVKMIDDKIYTIALDRIDYNRFENRQGDWKIFDLQTGKNRYTGTNRYPRLWELTDYGKNRYIAFSGMKNRKDSITELVVFDHLGNRHGSIAFPHFYDFYTDPISFLDGQKGVVVRDAQYSGDNFVWATQDGGHTWRSRKIKSFSTKNRVSSMALTPKCIKLATRDSIYTFNYSLQLQDAQSGLAYAHKMKFSSCDTGLVFAGGGVALTHDGGVTFQPVLVPNPIPGNPFASLMKREGKYSYLGGDSVYESSRLTGGYRPIYKINRWSPSLGLTRRRRLIDYDGNTNMFAISLDSGKTVQRGRLPLARLSHIKETSDSTYLLVSEGGGLHRLMIKDSLNINIDTTGNINIGLKDEEVETFHFFPNPAQSYLTVQLAKKGEKQLQIINLQGQVVWRQTITKKRTTINVSAFKPGLYILKMGQDARAGGHKFIISR